MFQTRALDTAQAIGPWNDASRPVTESWVGDRGRVFRVALWVSSHEQEVAVHNCWEGKSLSGGFHQEVSFHKAKEFMGLEPDAYPSTHRGVTGPERDVCSCGIVGVIGRH